MKPLIKWSGGKADEIEKFEKYIPEYETYIEPFFGGGSLFFHLEPKKAVLSDVHNELYLFYKCFKDKQANEIVKFMDKHKNEEEMYYQVRKQETNTDIEVASKFYYLRKTCYRGMLRYNKSGGFNVPFGRYKTMNYDVLKDAKYEDIFNGVNLYNESFEYIFNKYNSPKNFVFLDPPYDSVFTDYGYCTFGKEEHKRLAECFKKTKNKCLMVIGKTDFISELYDGYIVDEYEKKYRFKLHSGRVNDKAMHLVIKNY